MKHLNKLIILSAVLFSLGVFWPSSSEGSHFRGSPQFKLECLDQDEYVITMELLGECGGLGLPSSIGVDIKSSCLNTTITLDRTKKVELGPFCDSVCTSCDGGPSCVDGGYENNIYKDTIKLSNLSCCKLEFWFSKGARSSYSGVVKTHTFATKAMVNICQSGCPSPPVFKKEPLTVVCKDEQVQVNQTAQKQHPDDSLVYDLVRPFDGMSGVADYYTGYGPKEPLDYKGKSSKGPNFPFPYGFHLDQETGELEFTPVSIDFTVLVIRVRVYRNDTLIGEIRRDAELAIEDCSTSPSPPTLDKAIQDTYNACVGQKLQIDVPVSDPDNSNTTNLYFEWGKEINGPVYTNDSGKVSAKGTLEWTPDSSDLRKEPYQVTFKAYNDKCPYPGKRGKTIKIKVNSNPNPSTTHQHLKCGNMQFSASAPELDQPSFNWDIENGPQKSGKSFQYELNGGAYAYSLTAISQVGCQTTVHDTASVPNSLEIDAGPDLSTCQGDTIYLAPQAHHNQGNVSYTTPNDTFSDSLLLTPVQNKTLVVQGADTAGCQAEDSLKIGALPNPPSIQMDDQYFCPEEPLSVDASKYDNFIIEWKDTTGQLLHQGVQFEPQNPGMYEMVLRDSNSTKDCKSTKELGIYRKQFNPDRKLTNASICRNTPLEKSAPVAGDQHQWFLSGNGQTLGSDSLLSAIPGHSGTIVMEATSNFGDASCIYQDSFELQLDTLPKQAKPLSDQTICKGDTLMESAPLSGKDFQWETRPGQVLGSDSTLIATPENTTDIRLTQKSGFGDTACSYTDTFNVKVHESPDNEVSFSDSSRFCLNHGPVEVPQKEGNHVSWIGGSGVINDTLWSPQQAGPGTHRLDYEVQSDSTGCTSQNSLETEVLPLPDLNFSANPQSGEPPLEVEFTGNADGNGKAFSWQILTNEGQEATYESSKTITHTFSDTGTYDVVFSAENTLTGCRDTLVKNSLISVGKGNYIPLEKTNAQVRVYPNPASQDLTIESQKSVVIALRLTTLDGKTLVKRSPGKSTAIINSGNLSAGSYVLLITLENGKAYRQQVIFLE